ncbi:DUF4870 domain-containing protein [Microbacterium halophytorum]|uniref:DUF4870 domain-containing protein n=1 Tax=Microbacterium halophytorum TaxID=2067568 RepID=UPI001319F2F5|nr:DUF4870 domain-containing protein [Microbacterium halophytorum]
MTNDPTDPQNVPGGAPQPPQPDGQQAPPPPAPPQAPPAQPGQPPQYGAPQQPGGYQQPPQYGQQPPYAGQQPPQYGQPAYGQPYPGTQPGNITANVWLSVFFSWIPALIFYLVEKDTVTPVARKAAADNLNFQLIRTIAIMAAAILLLIPYLGVLLYFVVTIGSFVIAIINAAKTPGQVQRGEYATFLLAPSWVK